VRLSDAWRDEILQRLPELPLERRARFVEQYRLPVYDATLLTDERSLADYFEEAVKLFGGEPKTIANWTQNEVLRLINERGLPASELPLTPARLAELARLVEDRVITRQTAVGLIPRVIATGMAPRTIVEDEGLAQISSEDALRAIAQQVLDENPGQVAAYRAKPVLLKWFVGQVMKKSQGQANAQVAEKILSELLSSEF